MKSLHACLLLIIVCLGLFLPGITAIPVVDRDEAHFVQASKQMLESGNYFQVRFQETTRFRKPPGINWLQAGTVKLLSDVNDNAVWAYRLPSVLGGIFAVLLTFLFARRYLGERVALLAGALLACSVLLVYEAHLAVTDTMLLVSVVAMQGALWRIYHATQAMETPSRAWGVLFWLAMCLSIAIKGYGPIFPLLTIITLCIVERDVRWLRHLHLWYGALLLLIGTGWLWLIGEAEQANYFWKMMTTDALPKLVSAHESHGGIPGYHLALLAITFWPGSLFLWHTGTWAWEQRRSPTVKFLLAWLLPTWLFYELMPTKLPQYVLPLFPAIAILAAMAVMRASDNPWLHRWQIWLKSLYILWAVVSIAFITGIAVVAYHAAGAWLWASLFAILVVIVTVICALIYAWRQRLLPAAVSVIVGSLLTAMLLYQAVIPQLDNAWLSKHVANEVESQQLALSADNPLWVIGYSEPSAVFWLGTNRVHFTNLSALQSAALPAWLLLEKAALPEFKDFASSHDIAYTVTATVSGFNYSKGRWLTLQLIELHR